MTQETVNGEHEGLDPEEVEGDDIVLSIDDEGDIWIETSECKLILAPEEARSLGRALIEMADEAESEADEEDEEAEGAA